MNRELEAEVLKFVEGVRDYSMGLIHFEAARLAKKLKEVTESKEDWNEDRKRGDW